MVRWASKLEETNEADTSNLRAAMQKAASLAKDTILDFCTFLQTSLQEAGQSRHTIQWWFLFPVSLSHVPAAPLVWLRGGGGGGAEPFTGRSQRLRMPDVFSETRSSVSTSILAPMLRSFFEMLLPRSATRCCFLGRS